jgi:3-oxoacyl-[acyl-carrier protein] reductase
MVSQRSGVLIFITGSPARGHVSGATAIGTAFGALETFMENLAFEVGPFGVRSVGLRITANIDSRAIKNSFSRVSKMSGIPIEVLNKNIGDSNFLKVPMTLPETAKAVAFLASEHAQHMTGTVMNSSAGAAMD